MKPIGFSTEFIYPGKVGGAEYYAKNLIEGFLKILPDDDGLRLFGSGNSCEANSSKLSVRESGIKSGNRFLRETWSYLKYGREVRGMLFPNYFTPPLPKFCRVATVIHDAQYWHFPENFSAKKRAWLRAMHLLTLSRADMVIAISEFVKRDLLSIYGNRWEKKIKVIPNPVSWDRLEKPDGSQSEASQGRFILSVAAHYPHKNLSTLLRAFGAIHRDFPEVKLVLAGQLPENLIGANRGPDLRLLSHELGLVDAVTITGHISNGGLAQLFSKAELFVFPSLFEGFGIPPVEALGFGLPVITTARASLPEVTLGMARLLDNPTNPEELANEMRIILNDPIKYRKTSTEVARIRKHYSPERIAKIYYDVFS